MLQIRDCKTKLLICTGFTITYLMIFSISSYVAGLELHHYVLALPFERLIPLYPAWALVYLSINFYLTAAILIFPTWQILAAFAGTLLFETLIAGTCFIIMPTQLIYTATTSHNLLDNVVYFAQLISLKNNYFPSLHTAFAFTAAFIYSQYSSKKMSLLFYIWATAIPVATLFIHEHQIIDIFAGLLLALVGSHYILPWFSKKITT